MQLWEEMSTAFTYFTILTRSSILFFIDISVILGPKVYIECTYLGNFLTLKFHHLCLQGHSNCSSPNLNPHEIFAFSNHEHLGTTFLINPSWFSVLFGIQPSFFYLFKCFIQHFIVCSGKRYLAHHHSVLLFCRILFSVQLNIRFMNNKWMVLWWNNIFKCEENLMD